MKDHKVRGFLYTIAGAVGWGFSGTCCQYLFQNYEINTAWLVSARLLMGGAVILLAELFRKKGRIFEIFREWKEVLKLLFLGIGGLLFCQFAYLVAIPEFVY